MRALASLLSFSIALPLAAQKPRLELADSAKKGPTVTQAGVAPVTPPTESKTQTTGARSAPHFGNSAFVKQQSVIGALVYAPSFAATLTTAPVSRAAAYVVMAGGTFFAAAELSRDLTITPAMQQLSLTSPLIGGAVGAAAEYAMTGKKKFGAGVFFGSLLGTTGALTMGQRLDVDQATAATFGSLAMAGLAAGASYAADSTPSHSKMRAGVTAAATVAGMQLGAMYAAYAPYRVTSGDVYAVGTVGEVGALLASVAAGGKKLSERKTAGALAAGGLLGLVAGDRLVARRRDYTADQAAVLGLASNGGMLFGAGIATVAGAGGRWNPSTVGAMAAGAVAGMVLADHYVQARPDAGRRMAGRVTLAPQGLALAAAHVPGSYPLVSISF